MIARITIRSETDGDRKAIWTVNQSAFDSDSEANLVDALRDGGLAVVSLVAEAESNVVGQMLFSRLATIGRVGTAGLDTCRKQGHRIVVVLGHPNFYPRFGFSADLASPLENPFGTREERMAVELVLGAMCDVLRGVEYPLTFELELDP